MMKRKIFALILVTLFCRIVAAQPSAPLIKLETTAAENLKVFDALWSKVNEKYFDPKFNGVDWAKMKEIYRPQAEKAADKNSLLILLKRMLGELKTSHLSVWVPVSEKRLERKIGENFDTKRDFLRLGAGFDAEFIDGRHVVSNVENNTPAKIAGVEPGWTLLAVNDVPITSRSLKGVIEISEGGKINYKFLNNEKSEVALALESVFFVRKSLRVARTLENGAIGYIKFDGFTPGVADWLNQEIGKLKQAKTIIVDLRRNGGGLIEEVKDSLRPFFAGEVEFGTFVERSGKLKEKSLKGSGNQAFAGKVIVLIDGNSGSGSEIFSIIMQETGRAQVLGAKSSGAVLNSLDFNLPENFKMRIAFRDYLSPKGTRLEGIGVKPDVEVNTTTEDIRAGHDSVLERAISSRR